MSAKLTSILVLLATLALGIVMGILIHAQIMENRIDEIGKAVTREGFEQSMVEMLNPMDETQREEIEAILKRYGSRVHESFAESRTRLRQLTDSMETELSTVLSPKQLESFRSRVRFRRPLGGRPDSLLPRFGPPGFRPDSLRRFGPRGFRPDSLTPPGPMP